MNLVGAIKREKQKLEIQVRKLQHQLDSIRAAERALGRSIDGASNGIKKRVLSSAARQKISRAAKRRWAKVRAAAAKSVN
ncbi:MAG: hypothetical protein KGL02_05705 [Acidobacteriota bacterium]|nr:hypothetical protein [Acidobacteriota bacterium]MDE3170203.1 hypothetical protein [Acidobacteriota bacterium]